MASTLDWLAYEAGRLLKLVGAVISADGGPGALLHSLGWDLPPGVKDIGLAAVDLSALVQKVDSVEQALSSDASDVVLAEKFAELLVELQHGIAHLNAVIAGLNAAGDYLDKTQLKAELSARLNSVMAASRIGAVSPFGLLVLQFFGVVTLRHFDADPSIYQVEHLRTTFDWDALGRLFTDPVGLLEARYGWGTSDFDGRSFLTNLCALLEALGEPVRLRQLPRRVEEQLAGKSIPEADTNPATQLIASFIRGDEASGLDVGTSLFPLRPTTSGASDAGVAVCPFVFGSNEVSFPLSPQLTLEFDSTVALDSGIALQFRPGHAINLKAGLLDGGSVVDSATGKAIVRLTFAPPTGSRLTVLAIPGGGIEVDSIAFGAGVDASQGSLVPSFLARLAGGHARLNWDGSDGFLASIMPSGGIDVKFDLGASWSGTGGLSFQGSASADIDIALALGIAGLQIERLHIGLRPSDTTLAAEISIGGGANIGPVVASFDRVGTLAKLTFQDGNLGPLNLSLDFQPPSGVGLSVEAQGVVTGGGFLFHDSAQSLYAGSMQLSLNETITLSAFGLIATQMPDGSRGYSLIIFITAEDFQPIPLGLGFTLEGIGGMVAVNRTFDQDALRAGMQNDTLKALLFPRDPVGNAPTIIRALASAFPAQRGSYLLGILAKIGWFTPTLIELDLALILEFGARERLLVLGRISSLLPSADNDLVRINLDAIGVLDFDQDTAAIDAVLVDSRLVHKYALTGAAALRAGWGSAESTEFVLSIGGFNPRFAPPAGVPPLARVAIALSSGTNPRLTSEAYFAITSNTIQFGAQAQLHAEAYGFGIDGDIGYDVLIARAPLHFIADFHASVQLKHGSDNLFKVSVAGELEGPQPLRLSGKASFEIFWCDFSVRFDTTLVQGEPPPLPPAVDVLAQLEAALSTGQSWSTQVAPNRTHGVALRKLAPGSGLVLDPLGRLAVNESVVPLDTGRDIDSFGGAPVAGARRFALSIALNGVALTETQPLQARFAPAQFFAMTDDEELASPSFQTMDSGLVVGTDAVSFDAGQLQLVASPVEYQAITIDPLAATPPPPGSYTLPAALLAMHSASGAAGRAPLRRVGRARFRSAAPAAVSLAQPSWAIVPLDSGTPVKLEPGIKTWTDYRAALDTLNRGGAGFQLVPARDIAA
jgi:hypothetical protein